MAFAAGTQTYTAVATAAGAMTNLSAYIDNISNPQTSQQLDVTTMGNSASNFIYGLKDGDVITVSGPFDTTVFSHFNAIRAAGSTVGYIIGPAGSVASAAKTSGSVNVQNVTWSSQVGGRVEWSASLQITGAVTNTTW